MTISSEANVTITTTIEERYILEQACKIVKEMKHELFLHNDEADEFWLCDEIENGLIDLLDRAIIRKQ